MVKVKESFCRHSTESPEGYTGGSYTLWQRSVRAREGAVCVYVGVCCFSGDRGDPSV